MAKKSKQKKQKKEVKGKKARAKQKLDRQWGEVATKEHEKKQLSKRKGKSRILKDPNDPITEDMIYDKTSVTSQQELIKSSSDNKNAFIGSKNKVEWRGDLSSLLTKIKYSVDDFIRDHDEEDERLMTTQPISDDRNQSLLDLASPTATGSNGAAKSDHVKTFLDPSNDPYTCHFEKAAFDSEELAITYMDEVRNNTQEIDLSNFGEAWEMTVSGPLCNGRNGMVKLCAPSTNVSLSTVAKDELLVLSPSKLEEEISNTFTFTKDTLSQNWAQFNRTSLLEHADTGNIVFGGSKLFTAFQSLIYPALANYADILLTTQARDNGVLSLHNILALHVLNHTLTSRFRVLEHNRLLRQKEALVTDMNKKKEGATASDMAVDNKESDDDDCLRDQGYTRPKVLILLPTRGTCVAFVHQLLKLLGDTSDVSNMERFETDFGVPEEEKEDAMDDRTKSIITSKGPEWNELFGPNVNTDDDFKVGLSISPKQVSGKKKGKLTGMDGVYFNLYSDFYQSDIILASPLGIKMVVAGKEEDFLSSIEVCLVAYSDVLLMQNWDHIESVLNSINLQPKKIHESTDFSRVRNCFLAGQAAHFRQLIVTSCFDDPAIISTFKRCAKSLEGKLRLRGRVSPSEAAIYKVVVTVKQVFQRVSCVNLSTQSEARLKYFDQKILPQLVRLNQKRTLIYIPSYFDFVMLRNTLMKKEASFCSVTEYCKQHEISRNRAKFLKGQKNILLYTGRANFFMRFNIKGAWNLIFLGLPEHHEFYSDLLNKINVEGNNRPEEDNEIFIDAPPSCLALFTRYDAFALERIVGTKRCQQMINKEKGTFLFSS